MINPISTRRPFIIPIFLPHAGCPHQCVFCNQTSITGVGRDTVSPEKVERQIYEFLKYKGNDHRLVQVAFYGGNFLGLEKEYFKRLLNVSAKFVKNKEIDAIRFSTRPDTIDHDRIEIIKNYPVSTIEIGVQSMNDRVLAMAKRGHSASDTQRAVALLKDRHYQIGLQMMVGLPEEDEAGSLSTAYRIGELEPDFVRIYPTIVLKNSLLARWYENGTYRPWSLERSVAHVKTLYLFFKKKNIPVIRMGLQASEDLDSGAAVLAGPYHPAFGHMVHSKIFLDIATEIMEHKSVSHDTVTIKVHPKSISKMRGMKNSNMETLKRRFRLQSLDIVPDPTMDEDRLSIS
ncbi:MAG: radical SAM protein [Desulfobacterales bacterium]|jgi:histone acetyltransferase (RNA polymerase elongator complex component)